MPENPMMKRAQCAMVEGGALLWRNNVGLFYHGISTTVKNPQGGFGEIKLYPGDVVLRRPRRVKCGLDNGSSDLVGMYPVKVTQAMVGKTIGVFLSTEAKDDAGVVKPEQAAWLEMVNANGGISFVFRSVDESRENLRQAILNIQA